MPGFLARGLGIALLTTCAACTAEPREASPPAADSFEFEPGLFVPLSPVDPKADLPNAAFHPRPIDTSGYRTIANLFGAGGFDLHLTDAAASYEWPLPGSRVVLSREGTPMRLADQVYEHTGLDIIRQSEDESATVLAPTTGTAKITDWEGGSSWNDPYGTYGPYESYGDYSSVISIWDPVTHHVLQLMHVKPDRALPRTGFFEVARGQPLGELADMTVPGGRHTHVNVIDAEHFELIDPVTVLPSYPDATSPTIDELYVLDERAERHDTLASGALDLVVTAHDRDDGSPRNLEIASVAYTATDQLGNVLGRLERCSLADAFKQLAVDWLPTASTIRLIDFGNATGQFSGFWPSSDLGNPDRLFRYAVTNLRMDKGRCTVVAADRDGQLEISPKVTELAVTIDVWDARGNHAHEQRTLHR